MDLVQLLPSHSSGKKIIFSKYIFKPGFFFPSPLFSIADFITAWQDDSSISGPEIPRFNSYTWNDAQELGCHKLTEGTS